MRRCPAPYDTRTKRHRGRKKRENSCRSWKIGVLVFWPVFHRLWGRKWLQKCSRCRIFWAIRISSWKCFNCLSWEENSTTKVVGQFWQPLYREESFFVCSLCIWVQYAPVQRNFPGILLSSRKRSRAIFVSKTLSPSRSQKTLSLYN